LSVLCPVLCFILLPMCLPCPSFSLYVYIWVFLFLSLFGLIISWLVPSCVLLIISFSPVFFNLCVSLSLVSAVKCHPWVPVYPCLHLLLLNLSLKYSPESPHFSLCVDCDSTLLLEIYGYKIIKCIVHIYYKWYIINTYQSCIL